MNDSDATILNVDDNPDVLFLRSYLLRSAGFRVLEALTGAEALHLAATERPEVALLDINLPDISGIEVCQRIKSATETASTLVIQISSKFVQSSDRLEGLESGADSYLVDPVEPEILIATINSLLRLRKTLEKTRRQERTIDALLRYIPEGIAIADAPDFTIRKVSQYGLEMLRSPAAGEGAPCSSGAQMLAGLSSTLPDFPLDRATRRGEVVNNEELLLRREDGSEITALCNAAPILDDSGNIDGGVVAWRDISELKKAQKTPQALNEFLVLTNRHTRMDPMLDECAERILNLTGCSAAGVWIWGEPGHVCFRDSADRGRAFEPAEAGSKSPAELEEWLRGRSRHLGLDSVTFVPISVGTVTIGVIHVSGRRNLVPAQAETTNFLKAVAAQLGAAVERVKAQVALQKAHDGLEIRVRERTSELAALNRELDSERARLFELLDGIPSYVCLHGEDHTIKFTNRRFREIFGASSERPCYGAMAGRDTPCTDCPSQHVLSTNAPLERIWAAPDGRKYHVYHYPFSRGKGTRLVMELGTDITERLRVEQAVQAERNKLKAILDAMPQGIYITNQEHDIEYINPFLEREFGLVSGRKCHEYLHGQKEPCPYCPNERVFAGSDVRWEWTFPTTGKTYDLFDTPVTTLDGTIGKLEVFHDVTARKQSEEALRRSEEELRLLSAQLLSAQENERSRISRELHDELGQAMTLLKLQLGSVTRKLPPEEIDLHDQCDGVLSYIDSIIDNVRRLSRDLSPSILEDLGLTAAVRRLVQDFGKATGIHLTLELDSIDGLLPRHRGIMLYRVVQEALTNIARHSGASRVKVRIRAALSSIDGSIADDGTGFRAVASARGNDHGMGLTTMRERTRILGGRIDVSSGTGEGTLVSFSIPITRGDTAE